MGNNPSKFNDCGDDCPVDKVSWNDVQKFIKKLNQYEGKKKYRLPTEAEWEYACRAGSKTAFANGGIKQGKNAMIFIHNLDAIGWYRKNSGSGTHQVAQKKPNSWGLFDMHGNVSEWCEDWYWYLLPKRPVTNPINLSKSAYGRVLRGGNWVENARECRSASRSGTPSSLGYNTSGFRLVMNP